MSNKFFKSLSKLISGSKDLGACVPGSLTDSQPRTTVARPNTIAFATIKDRFNSLAEVQQELRRNGLESSNLIIGFDFTKSNEWTGRQSFQGRSLHSVGHVSNPYEEAIKTIGVTLDAFDDDKLFPCYGFGDSTTHDRAVFSFFENNQPANGLDEVLTRYRQVARHVKLAGPTSFAPLIYEAMRTVVQSNMQYHILLIVADGQVTQEGPTVQAIVEASHLPLSIIMVGVGDGPWDTMQEFDDALPARQFDNFQFVNFTEVMRSTQHEAASIREAIFAVKALMEIPEQYKTITRLGLLGSNHPPPIRHIPQPLPPPPTVRHADARLHELTAGSSGTLSQHSLPPQVGFFDQQHYEPGGGYHDRFVQPTPFHQPSAPPSIAPDHRTGSTASSTMASEAVESMFCCPITQELMEDPVICSDGYTYERSAIENWLRRHPTSPMTNQALETQMLIANHQLRSAIMEYKARLDETPAIAHRPGVAHNDSFKTQTPFL